MSDIENKIKEYREHLRFVINDQLNRFESIRKSEADYTVRLKSWCVLLYVGSVAVLFESGSENADNVWLYLVIGLMIIAFWFLNAYKKYEIEEFTIVNKLAEKRNFLFRMYEDKYTYEKLIEYWHTIDYKETQNNKSWISIGRFFKKKCPCIIKHAIALSNSVFFILLLCSLVVLFVALNYA